MTMNHSFDVELAEKIGLHEAIILQYISNCIEVNRSKNQYWGYGNWWVRMPMSSLIENFPYLTARQMGYSIEKLKNSGHILSANHNENKYDQTKWYALTEKGAAALSNSIT